MKYYISGGGAQRKTTERGAQKQKFVEIDKLCDRLLSAAVCRGVSRCGAVRYAHKIQRANNNCWQFTQSGCPLLLGLGMLLLWLAAFGRVLELALNKCPKALENALNVALHSSHSSFTAALRTPHSALDTPHSNLQVSGSISLRPRTMMGFCFGWVVVGGGEGGISASHPRRLSASAGTFSVAVSARGDAKCAWVAFKPISIGKQNIWVSQPSACGWVRPRGRNFLQGGYLGWAIPYHTITMASHWTGAVAGVSSRCQDVFVWMCLLSLHQRGAMGGPGALHPSQQCCIYYAIIKWQLCTGCLPGCEWTGIPGLGLTVIYVDDWQLGISRHRGRRRRNGASQDGMPFNWGMFKGHTVAEKIKSLKAYYFVQGSYRRLINSCLYLL